MSYSLGRMLSLVVGSIAGFCLLLFSLPYALRATEPAHRLPPGLGIKWLSCALLLALSIYAYVALGRLLRERERSDLEAVERLSRFEADGRPALHGLMSLALAALMAFGAWAGARDGQWAMAALCAAVFVLFLAGIVGWARQMLRPGPLLAMDHQGLRHAMFGVIPWGDVVGLSLREVQTRYVKASTLHLGVRMPHRFLAQAPWLVRWGKRDWQRTRPEYGTLDIPLNALDRKPRLVHEAALALRRKVADPLLPHWHPAMSPQQVATFVDMQRLHAELEDAGSDTDIPRMEALMQRMTAMQPRIDSALGQEVRRAKQAKTKAWLGLAAGLGVFVLWLILKFSAN